MTTRKKALTRKLQALNTLLDEQRPYDDDWSGDLLAALESIYELALRPEGQAASAARGNLAAAA